MMETTVTSGMCRCCASEGLFKDVNTTYRWMEAEEVYAEMLQYCFDITLSTAEDHNNGGICEVCITQLRNAANFKKQVLHTEEQFKRIQEQGPFKPEMVKVEMSLDDGINLDNHLSEDYPSGTEFDVPIKEESPEPKPKKRSAKATTSRAKKSKTDSGETSSKHGSSTNCPGYRIEHQSNRNIKLDVKKNFTTFIAIRPQIAVPRSRIKTSKRRPAKKTTELELHFDNIKSILRYSNATPIRCRIGSKYACGYCTNRYSTPAELKEHTMDLHASDKPECLRIPSLSRYLVYLDVTNLQCTLCDSSIQKLKDLMYHLKVDHEQLIHMDIKNHIFPFSFSEELRCVECSKAFDVFEDLLEHMSSHYKNYSCELCEDVWFVNKSFMMDHKKTVHFL